jgi:hypothetical protein
VARIRQSLRLSQPSAAVARSLRFQSFRHCQKFGIRYVSILSYLREHYLPPQETLLSMQDKAGAITRRSAGIPTLMASIIAAEPEAGGKLLARAMNDLVAEASVEAQHTNIEESRLPQVHAINCIKEIFTTSKLSVASEAYIAQGLELAAKTLNSNMYVSQTLKRRELT